MDGGYIGSYTGPPGTLGLYFEGNLSQTLNTVAGQRYVLKFTTKGDTHGGPPTSTIQATWDGRLVASYTFWGHGIEQQPRLLVTANGPATILRFTTQQRAGLDDVSVVPAPATQPEIMLTSPVHGSHYTMADAIALRSEVTAGTGRSVRRVDYYFNGNASTSNGIAYATNFNGINPIASATNAPYSATWNRVPPGTWYVSARVTDSSNEMTMSFPVQIHVAPHPTVTWSSPETDTVLTIGDNVPLSATVSYNPRSITRLVFRAGTNVVHEFQGIITNGLYTTTWMNAPEGEFTVSATGYDAAGSILSVDEARVFVLPPAVLDQRQLHFTLPIITTPTGLYAQTFTPSMNGELHHIDVLVYPGLGEIFPVTVSVVETVNGQPTGRELAQTTIPIVWAETTLKSAFFRTNRPVLRAGQRYAFIISAPLQTFGLIIRTSHATNQYSRGSMWRKMAGGPWEEAEREPSPNADMVFETYMIPNLAPIANAGTDQVLECRRAASGIQLDGSSSIDPEGSALKFQWSQGALLIGTGATARVEVPFGTNEFTLVVTDSIGLTSTDSVRVIVRDTLPPGIRNGTATPAILWPPNHRMASVQLEVDVLDICDPAPHFRIVNVTSNDPESSKTDWEVTGPLSLKLRAERAGDGDRVYTVTVAATDGSGNSSQHAVQVSVPRNRGETRPRLTRLATGGVSLDFETVPGEVYRVESSVDLVYWTPVTGWLSATEERSSCVDEEAVAVPRRFYRVVVRE